MLKELAEPMATGVAFTNVARDLRRLTHAGEYYDAGFDLLLRTQELPQLIECYSETWLRTLIQNVIAPADLDARLADFLPRSLPGNRRRWEPL